MPSIRINNSSLLATVIETKLCLYLLRCVACYFVSHCVLMHYRAQLQFTSHKFSIFPAPRLPFINKAGLLAWVHTCYFYLHVAGWVGPSPHLSFYSLHYLAGCVAATLTALLIARVCCCHPHFIMYCHQGVLLPPLWHFSVFQGVLLPPLLHALYGVCCCHPHITPGCTQQPLVPFTANHCVCGLYLLCQAINLLIGFYTKFPLSVVFVQALLSWPMDAYNKIIICGLNWNAIDVLLKNLFSVST